MKKTSKYRGVSWKTSKGKWVAQIKINGHQRHIGVFGKETEAAIAYNRVALRMLGNSATLNKVL